MAEMVPKSLPPETPHGEKRVFDALSRLPDDCIVYHEPKVAGRRPDFIVIIPSVGVLVIEVKDWYASTIEQADSQHVALKIDANGPARSVMHPARQAQAYMFGLMRAAQDHPRSHNLIHHDGERSGRFLFPFAKLVVFSRIGASPGTAIEHWDEVFSPEQSVYSSELNHWANLTGDALLDVIRQRFETWWSFDALNESQIDALRSIVHPELVIPSLSFPTTNEDELRILDLHQERQVRHIGGGHRILYGIAGSGKTVLLIARAKLPRASTQLRDTDALSQSATRALLARRHPQRRDTSTNLSCLGDFAGRLLGRLRG